MKEEGESKPLMAERVEELEDGNNIEVWAGGTDAVKEGVWETWNTREAIQVLATCNIIQI